MEQTEYNRQLFECLKDKEILDAKNCSPFESWEDFIEKDTMILKE